MSIKIANDTANGNVILKGQNVAGDRTITMPNLDCELAPRMQLMTAQNSTSGTSIDFTGIPSWTKKITVMFNGVSTSGTSVPVLQLGSGTIQTTGYLGSTLSSLATGAQGTQWSTSAVLSDISAATMVRGGTITISLLSGSTYTISGCIGNSETLRNASLGGSVALSSTLDSIRVTTVNGTDTFDAGQINVLYEG